MTPTFRFAPSPSGTLHLGGARTALFNWLAANSMGGRFILRIDDTNQEKSKDEYVNAIMDGLNWLGLDWDGGVVHQVHREGIYGIAVTSLLREGSAYEKDGAVYFRMPTNPIVVDDIVQGKCSFIGDSFSDFVIRRSDGSPTYHLASVVDDLSMKVTHIIRGDDHLNNAPKHIALMNALTRTIIYSGFTIPRFVHIPLIFGPDKKPLSKRHGAKDVLEYRDEGFLPEAVVNYAARLGWGIDGNEIADVDTMLDKFDLTKLVKSPSTFDEKKMLWTNKQHLQLADASRLARMLGTTERIINMHRGSCATLNDIRVRMEPYDKAPDLDLDLVDKHITPNLFEVLLEFDCKDQTDWTASSLKEHAEQLLADRDIKMKHFAQAIRVALTGRTFSASVFDEMEVIGKEECRVRIENAVTNREKQ